VSSKRNHPEDLSFFVKIFDKLAKESKKEKHKFGPSSSVLNSANEFLRSHSLGALLPYRFFDTESQLFINQSSIGFVIETLPLVGCREEYPKQLTGLFQHALPLGSNLQVLLVASSRINPLLKTWENARRGNLEIIEELAKERCIHLRDLAQGKGLRTFRLIISYSEPISSKKGISSYLGNSKENQSIDEIIKIREQLITTIKGWDLPTQVWRPEDLICGLDELLNPSNDLEGLNFPWNPHDSLSNQFMSPSTRLSVLPNQLCFEGESLNGSSSSKIMKLYTTRLLPPQWHLYGMSNFIGDPFDEFLRLQGGFFLSYGIHICDERTLKTKMLAKCGNVEKQAASPVAKYIPKIRKELEEWTYYREKTEEGQRLVRTRFQVGLLSDSENMGREEQTLLNLYRSQRWELALDKYLQLPSYLSCLPMTWGEGAREDSQQFQKTKTTLSHEPANLVPIQGEWLGTKSPGMILVGRRGQVFTWSPFDNDQGNYNTCVVGRSGSGKSVFMQELLVSMLGMGARVFVLDVGRSFEKTVKLLGGTYLEFSTHSPICINPFSSIPQDDPEAASDALAMLKPILSLMAAPKGGTKDIEDAYLEEALQYAWRERQTNATITDVADFLKTKSGKTATELGEKLRPYTSDGMYKRFFNGPATVDLSSNLVVVELEELKERKDLQSVIVQMVILQIANTVYLGDRQTPSCIILDEAWDMLRGKQSGIFIETAARRLRKYFGGLIVGTQSINDFYATPGAQAAFDNSDWMCLLSQKDESIELLKNSKRLVMDPAMERSLRSLRTEQGKYAEIMIKGPNTGFAIGRLLLDPFSKILYSTKADEFSSVQNLVSQGWSMKDAIKKVAQHK
jgi:conjugal transfer ATP-binding protein TraC